MFLWDYQIYLEKNSQTGALYPLLKVFNHAEAAGIPLTVVLLPYEYQLRAQEDEYWFPQDMVKDYLCHKGIPFRDAREWFTEGDSKDYFLFADGMHLSRLGHERVFRALVSDDVLSLGKLALSKEINREP